jgi:hypothetical protein
MTGKERNILERLEDKVDKLTSFMDTYKEHSKGCDRRFEKMEGTLKDTATAKLESDRESRNNERKLYLLLGGVGLIGALAGPFLAALFRKLLQVI